MRKLMLLLIVASLTTSCSSKKSPREEITNLDHPGLTAREAYKALEERLTQASTVLLKSQIRSTGAVDSDLAGEMVMESGNRVFFRFGGQFKSKSLTMKLLSDGRQVRGRGAKDTRGITPAALNDAILIGCTRMGILHNLAMMAADQLPDRSDGDVRGWVQTTNHHWGPQGQVRGQPARSIEFDVVVSGENVGAAAVWLSKRTGLPLKRTQEVRFENQTMKVVERYLRFDVNIDLPPGLFQIKG